MTEQPTLTEKQKAAAHGTTLPSGGAKPAKPDDGGMTEVLLSDTFRASGNAGPTGDVGDLFKGFFEFLFAAIANMQGDPTRLDRWLSIQNYMNKTDNYVDPSMGKVGIATFIRRDYDPDKDPNSYTNKARREMSPEEFASSMHAAQKLLGIIQQVESNGSPNDFYDIRKAIPGYNANDPKNAKLEEHIRNKPDFTQTSVENVIAWQKGYTTLQREYTDNNFPLGIPVPQSFIDDIPNSKSTWKAREQERLDATKVNVVRSSAAGTYQFVYTTLDRTVEGSPIVDKSDLYNETTQTKCAMQLLVNTLGQTLANDPNASPQKMLNDMVGQWEGLGKLNATQRRDALAALNSLGDTRQLASIKEQMLNMG